MTDARKISSHESRPGPHLALQPILAGSLGDMSRAGSAMRKLAARTGVERPVVPVALGIRAGLIVAGRALGAASQIDSDWLAS